MACGKAGGARSAKAICQLDLWGKFSNNQWAKPERSVIPSSTEYQRTDR
jgi:hypothetical protein